MTPEEDARINAAIAEDPDTCSPGPDDEPLTEEEKREQLPFMFGRPGKKTT